MKRRGTVLEKTAIVWFRSDLRLHDNIALHKANTACAAIVPVYCFDPAEFGKVQSPWSSAYSHSYYSVI